MDKGFKSYWAEFLGTFTLCLIGEGAICANQLAGGGSGLLGVAIAHGLALCVMVSALGAVSGGHFNPAVTFGFLITGKHSLPSTIAYWIAQLAGAVAASYLVSVMFPAEVWQAVKLGAAGLAPHVSMGTGILIEAIATFFLVTAVWGTAVDPRAPKIGGFGIGLAVLMDILFCGPLTGAAMNPARAFGPAVIAGAWNQHIVWWIGPMVGAALAALIYKTFVLEKA